MSNIDFIVIGAQKAGSSSLFEYMRNHPQIHMPSPKGSTYFFNMDRNYSRGWDWYHARVLRGAPPDAVCGEATIEYIAGTPFGDIMRNENLDSSDMISPFREPLEEVVPRRINQVLPDVKLICVLRDPVMRAYSHYRMMAMERAELRSFEEAIDQLMEPTAMERGRIFPTRTNCYITNGEYGRALDGYLRVFSRDQLMVIFTDELAKRPAETLGRLFEFIGVASDFVPSNLGIRYREAAVKQRIPGFNPYTWQSALSSLGPARALWHGMPERVRFGISHAYSAASYRIGLWNAQRGVAENYIPPSARNKLIAHFQPDSERLGSILDMDIPWLEAWAHLRRGGTERNA